MRKSSRLLGEMRQIGFHVKLFLLLILFLFSSSCTKDVITTSELNNNSNSMNESIAEEERESVKLETLIEQEGLGSYYKEADETIKKLENYTNELEDKGYNTIRIKVLLDEAKKYLTDAEDAILFDEDKGALSLLLNAKGKAEEGIEKGTYLENTRSEESSNSQNDANSYYENIESDNSQNEEFYETDTSTQEVTPTEPEDEELIIDTNVIKSILKKLPVDDLDSSIDIGIGTRANGEFKYFYTYMDKSDPKVQEKSFDKDKTKVMLDITYDTLVILYSTSESSMCSTMQKEIELNNIIYDTENIGFTDTFKSGVSELKECFEG